MTRDELKAYLEANFAGRIVLLDTGRYDLLGEAKAEDFVAIARSLRDDEQLKFNFLCNMGGVDTGERLEVIYSIASTLTKTRFDIKLALAYEGAEVDSIQTVWPAANWYEREMYELYGIGIRNHDDLRPLLLPDDWDQGHPMRKDWDAPDFERLPEL